MRITILAAFLLITTNLFASEWNSLQERLVDVEKSYNVSCEFKKDSLSFCGLQLGNVPSPYGTCHYSKVYDCNGEREFQLKVRVKRSSYYDYDSQKDVVKVKVKSLKMKVKKSRISGEEIKQQIASIENVYGVSCKYKRNSLGYCSVSPHPSAMGTLGSNACTYSRVYLCKGDNFLKVKIRLFEMVIKGSASQEDRIERDLKAVIIKKRRK